MENTEKEDKKIEWDISGYEFNRTPTIGDLRSINLKGNMIQKFKALEKLEDLDNIPEDIELSFDEIITFGLPMLNMRMSKGAKLTENTPAPLFFKLLTSGNFKLDFLG